MGTMKIAFVFLMKMVVYGHQYTTVDPCPPISDDCCGDLGVCPYGDGICDMQSTCCPSGCCPEPNWYCCPDWFCAATAADCAFASILTKFLAFASILAIILVGCCHSKFCAYMDKDCK